MKLSNIGSKIVNVGETIILPGKDATVSENWRKNDVVAFLVEKGYLAISTMRNISGPLTLLFQRASSSPSSTT